MESRGRATLDWKIRGNGYQKGKSAMKTIARLSLPQGLAAPLFALNYLVFCGFGCRYRAERLTNRASQDVENPWNLFAGRSGARHAH